jgi:pimeloyl-ACP methyl ester carboxylesterase
MVLMGYSWGTVLALEYAVRYPERVSRRILMNPAPVCRDDFKQLRQEWMERLAWRLRPAESCVRLLCLQRGRSRRGDCVLPHPFWAGPKATAGTRADPRLRSSFTQEGMATLKDCGHFAYLECPAAVRGHIDAFFRDKMTPAPLQ